MAQLFTIQENEGENGKEEENAAAAKTLTLGKKIECSLTFHYFIPLQASLLSLISYITGKTIIMKKS